MLVGFLELKYFSFKVLDIEFVFPVFLVDFLFLLLEFFILFSEITPVNLKLESFGLLFASFVTDEFLQVLL